MEILNKIFEREFSNGFRTRLITELLIRKLNESGIQLSERQKGSIKRQVESGNPDNLHIKIPSRENRSIEIQLTDSDVKVMEQTIENWTKGLPELVESMASEASEYTLKVLKRDWPRQERYEDKQRRGFMRRLEKRWRKPFDLLGMLITCAKELGEDAHANLSMKADPDRHHLTEALTRLHARACQIASEVMALLRNGFADGAMARWRTIHEVATVSLLILKGGESLAERYILHAAEESRRAAYQYQKYAERLGFEPYSVEELASLDKECLHLEQRFGEHFSEEYGWASDDLKNKRPSFALIEQAVGIDHLRPFYRMASHNVHANPKGVFFKLGLMDESEVILAGPSDYGLADPGQNTALSLVQVTTALLSLDVNFDTAMAQELLLRLSHEIGQEFVTVQRELEEELTD